MFFLQDLIKVEYIFECYEKLIVWNIYYLVKMKCIGVGKVFVNEREKLFLMGEGYFCIWVQKKKNM